MRTDFGQRAVLEIMQHDGLSLRGWQAFDRLGQCEQPFVMFGLLAGRRLLRGQPQIQAGCRIAQGRLQRPFARHVALRPAEIAARRVPGCEPGFAAATPPAGPSRLRGIRPSPDALAAGSAEPRPRRPAFPAAADPIACGPTGADTIGTDPATARRLRSVAWAGALGSKEGAQHRTLEARSVHGQGPRRTPLALTEALVNVANSCAVCHRSVGVLGTEY